MIRDCIQGLLAAVLMPPLGSRDAAGLSMLRDALCFPLLLGSVQMLLPACPCMYIVLSSSAGEQKRQIPILPLLDEFWRGLQKRAAESGHHGVVGDDAILGKGFLIRAMTEDPARSEQ